MTPSMKVGIAGIVLGLILLAVLPAWAAIAIIVIAAAIPVGGYLAIYDSSDADPGLNDALHKYNESGAVPYRVRRPDQIARYFDGLELVDPGVVPIQEWRPDPDLFVPTHRLTNLGGVARKPLSSAARRRK